MKSTKLNLTSVALATSMALGGVAAVPTAANAEVSASFAMSNMYLWRGQNISTPSPAISGSLDYGTGGFYAGIWMSSEGPFDASHETDLYFGYGGEIGGFTYDISYFKYLYPEAGDPGDLGDTDLSDVVLSVGFGPVSVSAYMGVESGSTKDDYYTVAGTFGDFTVLYGLYQSGETADGADYSHVQLSYAFNDELTFTVSKASDDGYGLGTASRSTVFEEDPLFQVTWAKSFSL